MRLARSFLASRLPRPTPPQNVTTPTLTNEAGAYIIPAFAAGDLAELPGFHIARYTDVVMRTSAQIRLNFTLRDAGLATAVEVAVSADQLLVASSPSVGELLKEQEVRDVPLVQNNVLDHVQVTAGVVTSTNDTAFGAEDTRFPGVSAMSVNISRDGIPCRISEWPTGISGSTVVHPDLIGEMTYARSVDSGKPLVYETLDLVDLVEVASEPFHISLAELGFQSSTDIPSNLPRIRVDRTAMV